MSVSILILTLNEEVNLSDCLASVAWSDDIVVFDSHSSDRTIEIAQAAGAHMVQRRFDNYAAQRNAALNDVTYRHPWLLMLDADERVTPELHSEIIATLEQADADITLYRMRRQDLFFGRWLKRSSGYPTWFGRLMRIGRVRVEREINEEYHTDGKISHLREHLLHYPFNKGVAYWIERHNRYSSMEAKALLAETQGCFAYRDLWTHDPVRRRKALKQFAYRLPARPLLVFLYLYLWRGGLLDGGPGFTFCLLRTFYEFMIDLKVRELRWRERGLPV
ncbi:MAG: glycosyltransferase family 2 protein [Proteobacteria bacterium]|nr:glycosyltransferase family 2 protein [Pseudomonadota bacterium]